MADRGRYTPAAVLKRIAELARLKKTEEAIARACGVSRPTVRKYRPPDAEPNPPGRPPAAKSESAFGVAVGAA